MNGKKYLLIENRKNNFMKGGNKSQKVFVVQFCKSMFVFP
jgi:hypothetical protein